MNLSLLDGSTVLHYCFFYFVECVCNVCIHSWKDVINGFTTIPSTSSVRMIHGCNEIANNTNIKQTTVCITSDTELMTQLNVIAYIHTILRERDDFVQSQKTPIHSLEFERLAQWSAVSHYFNRLKTEDRSIQLSLRITADDRATEKTLAFFILSNRRLIKRAKQKLKKKKFGILLSCDIINAV